MWLDGGLSPGRPLLGPAIAMRLSAAPMEPRAETLRPPPIPAMEPALNALSVMRPQACHSHSKATGIPVVLGKVMGRAFYFCGGVAT
jgi:hypothetical protein